MFVELPHSAAWRHLEARDGFEVVFLRRERDGGLQIKGNTAAVEGDDAWAVHCELALAAGWLTRSASVAGRSTAGVAERQLRSDGAGHWHVDETRAPHLDGCLDVDLESSCLTNAFPVQRLGLEVGEEADAPAAYVRALDLGVERLEQRYARLEDDDAGRQRYHYAAPAFDFEAVLIYDESGLLVDYPGIGTRVA